MVSIEKIKRKMDEIIAKTTSTSKEKPYIGYQFPITNPSYIRLRKKDLSFKSEGVDLKIEVFKSTPHYDQIIPKIGGILHNLEGRVGISDKRKTIPWYGIASLVSDILGLMLILIFFSTLDIEKFSYIFLIAIPFSVVGIICGYIGSKWMDYTRGVAYLGIALGIILFFISIWQILYLVFVILIFTRMQ